MKHAISKAENSQVVFRKPEYFFFFRGSGALCKGTGVSPFGYLVLPLRTYLNFMKTNFVRLSTGGDLWEVALYFFSQDESEEKTVDLFKEDV